MPRGTVDANRPDVHVRSEKLVEARTDEIVAAAVRVFSDKGFHGATIRDLATELGVSVGTIFNYFPSKDEVLLAVLERPQRALVDALERFDRLAASTETLVEMMRTLGAIVDDYRPHIKLVYQDLKAVTGDAKQQILDREDYLVDLLERAIEGAAQEQGVVLKLPPRVAANNALVIGHAWAFRHWAFASVGDVEAYLDVQVPALLRSVGLSMPAESS